MSLNGYSVTFHFRARSSETINWRPVLSASKEYTKQIQTASNNKYNDIFHNEKQPSNDRPEYY